MAKQNEALFEESSQGAVSAVTATIVVLSIVLLIGGLVLMGYSFQAGLADTPSLWLFIAGFFATTVSFAIPFNLLPSTGK